MNVRRHFLRRLCAGAAWPAVTTTMLLPHAARAHGARVGDIEIDHPYALPTVAGVPNGAVYLRHLRNQGDRADRLVAARTPAARAVEFHHSSVDAQQVVRMRARPAIDLPPRSSQRLRHGGEWHLMLIDLQKPLSDGDRFPLALRFEHAGEREVVVWVQRVRGAPDVAPHRH
jgi:copper(I)-binding protein